VLTAHSDDDSDAISCAAFALNIIAKYRDGAQTIVDAKVSAVLLELLDSDNCRLAADMLQILTTHDVALRLLDLKFCTQLVSLLPQVSIA
jgi:hypothetical protein